MMGRDEIIGRLRSMISKKRFAHSLRVEKAAVDLAERFGGSIVKASIAGLVHDCAKDIPKEKLFQLSKQFHIPLDEYETAEPELIHGIVGAEVSRREFGILDEEILSAVCYHTTGRENMTLLDKIIYLADLIEPGRSYPGVEEIRAKALANLDEALVDSLYNVITYVLSSRCILHPRTIFAWNDLMKKKKEMDKDR